MSSCSYKRDNVENFRHEELTLDDVLRRVADDENEPRQACDLVPVYVVRKAPGWFEGSLANDLVQTLDPS